jgi:hypothetical protein
MHLFAIWSNSLLVWLFILNGSSQLETLRTAINFSSYPTMFALSLM